MALDAPIEAGHTWVAGDSVTVALLNKFLTLAKAIIPTPISLANGGSGATGLANAQKNFQCSGRLAAWVEYTDAGAAVFLGTLPADSFYTISYEDVTVAFTGTGTDLLTIGWTADNDALATSQDISTTGVKTPTVGANHGYNSTAQTVNAYYLDANADAGAGKVLCVVEYWQVPTSP